MIRRGVGAENPGPMFGGGQQLRLVANLSRMPNASLFAVKLHTGLRGSALRSTRAPIAHLLGHAWRSPNMAVCGSQDHPPKPGRLWSDNETTSGRCVVKSAMAQVSDAMGNGSGSSSSVLPFFVVARKTGPVRRR
jgi:hypothetical protein